MTAKSCDFILSHVIVTLWSCACMYNALKVMWQSPADSLLRERIPPMKNWHLEHSWSRPGHMIVTWESHDNNTHCTSSLPNKVTTRILVSIMSVSWQLSESASILISSEWWLWACDRCTADEKWSRRIGTHCTWEICSRVYWYTTGRRDICIDEGRGQ